MESLILALHSWLRWVALLAGVWAVSAAFARRAGRSGLIFTVSLDVQMLLGLSLYLFLSPITTGAFSNMAGAMQNRTVRFWAVEHPTMMIAALVLAHVGHARMKRGKGGAGLLFLLALLAILAGIPWPGLPYGRPLVPAM
jgi:hypothetical protein